MEKKMALKSDIKRDYLARTFERTRGKKYENYILSAIWHKLGRNDIQPVTQQYIKRKDNNYALLDMYFPQLNISVEVDEGAHDKSMKSDKVRTIDISERLSSCDEKDLFKELRVDATDTLENINKEIDDIVATILKRIKEGGFPEWRIDAPYETAIECKRIRVADMLAFRTKTDVYRCFNKVIKGMQRAQSSIEHGYQVWCPRLALDIGGEKKAADGRWVNILTDDWNEIHVMGTENAPEIKWDNQMFKEPHITFAKSKDALGQDAYRFIGVYTLDLNDTETTTVRIQGKDDKNEDMIYNTYKYKRLTSELDLSPWLQT